MKGHIVAGDGITEPYEYAVICSVCMDSERTCVACVLPDGDCACEPGSEEFRQGLIDNYWGGDPCLELDDRDAVFREEHRSRYHPCVSCP